MYEVVIMKAKIKKRRKIIQIPAFGSPGVSKKNIVKEPFFAGESDKPKRVACGHSTFET